MASMPSLTPIPRSNLHFFFNFAGEAANFTTYVVGGPLDACGTISNPASGCAFYNNLPVSYVPNYTLNAGVYYGIQHHNHTILEPRFWVETHGFADTSGRTASGAPTTQTMPSYTTANLSFNAPISLRKSSPSTCGSI